MTTFKATTEGTDKLCLRAVLERYANDQWLPDYNPIYQGSREPLSSSLSGGPILCSKLQEFEKIRFRRMNGKRFLRHPLITVLSLRTSTAFGGCRNDAKRLPKIAPGFSNTGRNIEHLCS